MNDPILFIVTCLGFAILNGYLDGSSIVATAIASRAIDPRQALLAAAAAEMCGPLVLGVAVARTIGSGLLNVDTLNLWALTAALLAAIAWNLIALGLAVPSSSTHALIGGLVGASLAHSGLESLNIAGLTGILASLVLSPLLGMVGGYAAMHAGLFILRHATPRANGPLRRMQWLTILGLALSHGGSDGPKTMGVIVLGLLASGTLSRFAISLPVMLASAAALAFGVSLGGWRLIRTLGGHIYHVRPLHALASQIGAGGVILIAALLGGPISATQVVSSSIVGAGAADRINQVRWGVFATMLQSWILTMPVSAALAAGLVQLAHL
jgi:PiT family inorganic phosphate transporter